MSQTNTTPGIMLSNKTYDFFKRLVQVILPAFASLYFGLSQIWGLPAAEEVVGTIALLTTFLGVLVGVSHNNYEKSEASTDGTMAVDIDGGGIRAYSLELKGDPEGLAYQDKVTFRVQKNPALDDL